VVSDTPDYRGTPLQLMEEGTIKRVHSEVTNATVTLYTVPTGKKAYLFAAMLNVRRIAAAPPYGYLGAYDGSTDYPLLILYGTATTEQMNEAIGYTAFSLPAGWSIRLYGNANCYADGVAVVVETDA